MPTAAPTRPSIPPPTGQGLPRFHVVLHNDDKHDMYYVTDCLHVDLPFSAADAWRLMYIAHHRGLSLLLTVHRELAELYRDKLRSRGLTISLKPA